jgi:hypothetical protein
VTALVSPLSLHFNQEGGGVACGAVSPLVKSGWEHWRWRVYYTVVFPSMLAHGMWLARVRAHKQRLRRPACTQLPTEWWLLTCALLPHSQSFTTHWSTTSTTPSTALAGVICHYQVTEKVFPDGCDSTNLFSQFGLFTIVAHLQYNHLHAVRGSMQHVTSTSCWHTATAFHLRLGQNFLPSLQETLMWLSLHALKWPYTLAFNSNILSTSFQHVLGYT